MGGFFFRDPRAFALAAFLILAMGASAWTTAGRQEDPTITNIFATILTPYPGADPARVEALVTEKIEEELRGVAAIDAIESASRPGLSFLRVELDDRLSDAAIESAWTDIRNALDDAARAFPPGVPAPEFTDDRFGAFTLILALTPEDPEAAGPADRAVRARLADALADRLRALPGTALVETYGAAEEEISVALDPDRLAGLGLRVSDVAAALAAADAKAPAGAAQGPLRDVALEVDGAFDAAARIRAIPLRAAPDGGATLRLGDLAEVARAEADPPATLARLDGADAVLVAARMEADLRVDLWAARARAVAADFAAALPPGVRQTTVFDQSVYTAERFAALGRNIATGAGLVAATLLVTLGWSSAVVVATVIPLTALVSLWALTQFGLSIHQMSVTGMIVAFGLLVDAAIVMTDAIKKRLEAGAPRGAAIAEATRALTAPLVAATATTVLSFLPMVLTPGPVGDFIGAIGLAVIVMLIASLALTLTLTPALAGWLLPAPDPARPARWWREGASGGALARAFDAALRAALARPGVAVAAALALPLAGFAAFPTLTAQFFPGADRDQLHVQLALPQGASIRATEAAVAEADAILRAAPEIRSVAWVIGESAPAFYYNMAMDQDGEARFAEALVTTASPAATQRLAVPLQRALDEALPQARAILRLLGQGPPVGAPVELRFVGPDLGVLRDLAERARAVLAATPGVTHARDTASDGGAKLVFAPDPDAMRRAGLDEGRIAAELAAALGGAAGGSVVEGAKELPVRARLVAGARTDGAAVGGLAVLSGAAAAQGADWAAAPLRALGALRLAPAGAPIHRRNGERIALVQGFVAPGVLPEEVLAALRPELDAALGALPAGYRLEIGGDADARADTVRYLTATVGLVAALAIATLTLSLGSLRLMAATLVVAALSAGLALLTLAVLGYPFGVTALIGAIGSVGVSVNAAIVIFDALQADPEARAGDRGAMARVVTGAGRHIVSTTVTTVGGFLPLIFGGGGFWPPFAAAIAGGVALSTLVSFFFAPPVYALIRPRPAPRPAAREAAQRAA